MERTKRKIVRKKRTPAKKATEVSLGIELGFKAIIPRPVLSTLLDLAGKPSDISPRHLMGNAGKLYPYQLAELYGNGFIELPRGGNITLSSTFLKIAGVLLNPQTNLTFRIWGDSDMCGETNIQFPGHIIDGDGVVLNQVDTSYQIGAFARDSDILKLLMPLIPDIPGTQDDFQFEGNFDVSVIAVLLGFIDIARRLVKERGSDKVAEKDIIFSSLQVNEYLFNQWGLTGFEDFLTYIATILAQYEPPSLSEIAQGLEKLVKANVLVQLKRDTFSLSPVLMPLVFNTVGDQSGFQWQRITRLETGELFWSERIFLFCDKSMILQFAPSIENRVHVARVNTEDVMNFLKEELTLPPLLVAPVPPTQSEITKKPSAPVEKMAVDSTPPPVSGSTQITELEKICSHCGSKNAAEMIVCTNCGRVLPSAAQVTRSAQKIPQPASVEAKAKVEMICRYCGRANSGEAATCKYCGMPLAIKGKVPSTSRAMPSQPVATTIPNREDIARIQEQLVALQKDMKTYKLELNKIEVRHKVGELSAAQYTESVNKLHGKLSELAKTAEQLNRKLQA